MTPRPTTATVIAERREAGWGAYCARGMHDQCVFNQHGCKCPHHVPVEPPATPGLRGALDAHEWLHGTPEFPGRCACGWISPSGSSYSWAEWADHREAAVRAALSGPPATPEPPRE